jgi:Ras-related protein Rab-7A
VRCSYVDQKFLQSYKATVGADFMEKEVIVDGKVINLEVPIVRADLGHGRTVEIPQPGRCLLPGSRLLRAGLRHHQQTRTPLAIQSFDNLDSWITEFLNQGAPKEPDKFPFILVGNKIDREEDREIEEASVQ